MIGVVLYWREKRDLSAKRMIHVGDPRHVCLYYCLKFDRFSIEPDVFDFNRRSSPYG